MANTTAQDVLVYPSAKSSTGEPRSHCGGKSRSGSALSSAATSRDLRRTTQFGPGASNHRRGPSERGHLDIASPHLRLPIPARVHMMDSGIQTRRILPRFAQAPGRIVMAVARIGQESIGDRRDTAVLLKGCTVAPVEHTTAAASRKGFAPMDAHPRKAHHQVTAVLPGERQ